MEASSLQKAVEKLEEVGPVKWEVRWIWGSLVAQLVKNPPTMQETQFNSWVGKIRWRRDRLPTPVFLDFPWGSAGKKSACNVGDLGLIPGLGRSPGEGKGYPLQYSGLENSKDCIVHGLPKSWTRLSLTQMNMVDEEEIHGPICSTFEALVVWHAVGHCPGEEFGPFY